jgi:methylthioribose-1-phosphate isomerase
MAALAPSSGPVPVYVCAPIASFDPDTPDGAAIPAELLNGGDVALYQTGYAARDDTALSPAVDVIPAGRITAIVTEMGVLRAPFEAAIASAVADRAARREPPAGQVA